MFLVIRKIFFVLSILTLIIGGVFLFSQNSKSYNDKTTHPGLTDEIVDFYNLSFNDKFTIQEKEWIVQGSIDEDTPPRWINHFYDPTTGDGWKAENLGEVSPLTLRLFSKIFFNVNTEIVSSKNWVHNEILQLKYEDYGGNRTWENAIRRYANGDKEYAYKTLGHILHLLEDKTVPDHTRNDTHAHEGGDLTKDGGSPYEDYSSDWNRWNLNIAQDLKNNSKLPIILNSIDAYFDALANYSNQYFFSEHTIKSEKYRSPDINNLDEKEFKGVLIGYSRNDKFPLVKIKKSLLNTGDIFIEYSINEKYILENYFSRLSSTAVLNGAGVIKLFKEEVAKAEKDKSLIPEEPKISWWQKMRSPLYGVIIPAYDSVASVFSSVQDVFSGPQIIDPMALVANIGQAVIQTESGITNQESRDSVVQSAESAEVQPPREVEPLVGQGDNPIDEVEPRQLDTQLEPEIIHAPYYRAPEVIHAPYQTGVEQTQDSIQDSNIITSQFQGQFNGSFTPVVENQSQNILPSDQNNAEADSQQDSLTGSEQENISSQESIEQSSGEETQNQNTETQSEETPTNSEPEQEPPEQDIIPPEIPEIIVPKPTFYLTDYDVRKMNFTLNWGDANGVIKEWELQYKLAPNFEWIVLANSSSLIANSFDFTAKYDDLNYYFRLRGQDADGNFGDWLTLEAEISTKPVVINEIAWRGTEASYNDEWMELANKTNQEIDLNGWILKTNGATINITLIGKIAANGFYLLERTADTTISNIPADQIYTGALRDAQDQYDRGDSIYLYDKDNNIVDQTRTVLSGRGSANRVSSERISIWSNGNYIYNWLAYSGSGNQEAQDANGNPVYGTPRAKNSQADKYFALNSGVFEAPPSISKDTIFLKNRSPYTANGSVEATNIEVLIEPGASLEFNNFGMLRIHNGGKLIAKGTENEKITIKTSTSNGVALYFSGAKGEFENLEISGGKVVADNSTIKITNSAIKNANGLLTLQNNSEFDISNSEFSGDNGYNFAGNPYYGEAILIKQSQGIIQNSKIKNNQAHGIYIDSFSGALDIHGNNFSSNGIAPIATNGFINIDADNLNLDGNVFGANDALMIYNPTVKAGEEAIISSQMLYFLYPQAKGVALYQIINPKIETDGILRIEPGAIIKFNDKSFLNVYGELEAMGTPEKPIVLKWQYDYGSYDDMVSNIAGTVSESSYIQLNDGSEAVLENVITREKIKDRFGNTSYQSFNLVWE